MANKVPQINLPVPSNLSTPEATSSFLTQLVKTLTSLFQYVITAINALIDESAYARQIGKVVLHTNQNIPTSNLRTAILFDTVSIDPSGIWDATNHRFAPTVQGWYKITLHVSASWTSANGLVIPIIQVNGGDLIQGTSISGSAITSANAFASTMVHLNGTTDTIQGMAYIQSTGTMTVLGADVLTILTIELLAPGL